MKREDLVKVINRVVEYKDLAELIVDEIEESGVLKK